ncbi:uncharacterized protein LACBIDRAFT_303014 [Laccaria bicolor S238N-H82]|uniref:Predicted protein n=1 Tax=Laccaria bicolor (strain S238N-H82 / ATCC MYA-4686) TaxID=486041 RepID=B0E462_LACBS|nr:uncharacterized protein LACBIDRAFT_303014 [Laccaria bicolor S238N-H82]EDQ98370.1 predicted protein [Laccaria bicolor S238N-H82]|eukprot:XP_001890980.1 predicted protein [Laccaria bicolor S238N-H82]
MVDPLSLLALRQSPSTTVEQRLTNYHIIYISLSPKISMGDDGKRGDISVWKPGDLPASIKEQFSRVSPQLREKPITLANMNLGVTRRNILFERPSTRFLFLCCCAIL